MANFTVRVEFHQATAEDYNRLHEAMRRAGYKLTIAGRDGVEYRMPTAEYNLTGDDRTAGEVCDEVKAIADRIKPRPKLPWVLVTKGTRSWRLDEA